MPVSVRSWRPSIPSPLLTTDINRVVRVGDYMDADLARLSFEACELWKRPEWEGTFHQTGFASWAPETARFNARAIQNVRDLGIDFTALTKSADLQATLHRDVLGEEPELAVWPKIDGYYNPASGWAEAARAIALLHKRILTMGGKIKSGSDVVNFVTANGTISAVSMAGGEQVEGDLFVCAAGAWCVTAT